MYVVTVDFLVKPQHFDAFLEAMNQQAKDSLAKEPNCRYFDVCIREDNPNAIFLYEIYDSKADFDAHLQSDHFINFSAKVADWVEAKNVAILSKVA